MYDHSTTAYSTTSTYLDLDDGELQYGVNYGVRVKASSPNGTQYDSDWTNQIEQITRAKQPILEVTETTSTSIKVRVTGLEDNYYRAYVNLYNSGDGSSPSSYIADDYVTGN
ncbi:MAG: hypothetical protein K9L56_14070 [Clostridiales bacterium]|nr:hypothetical protein [Clostridiales bacterium]